MKSSMAAISASMALLVRPGLAAEVAQQLERVEIVGSHLKRADAEPPTPVSVYRRAEIEATGAQRLSDFLLALPYAGAQGFDDRSTALGPRLGAAGLSLRGLGPSATLVLLNGRRIAASGVTLDDDSSFVDLNSLPLAAVERVEVLRDGASAIYGADAIAGVVNIVLRRDFRGGELSLRGGASGRGDDEQRGATLALGGGDEARDGRNGFVMIEAGHQAAMPATARAFSRSADQRARGGSDLRAPGSSPPSVYVYSRQTWQAAPGCPAERLGAPPFGSGTGCVFDTNAYADLLPRVDRLGVLAVGGVRVQPTLRLFAELMANETQTGSQSAPGPLRANVPGGLSSNPYQEDVRVAWRPLDPGPRRERARVRFAALMAGAEGSASSWEWSLVAGANRIGNRHRVSNQLRASVVREGVAQGTIDPFRSDNDLSAATVRTTDRYTGEMRFVQGSASTELLALPAGPLALAIGLEARHEAFATALDPWTLSGDLAFSPGTGTFDADARRRTTAAYAEINWPAAEGLELQLALRTDRYSDAGGATSPKLALRWQPLRRLLLRASWGRGFLPPSLLQSHRPRSNYDGFYADPIRCPVTGAAADCDGTFVPSSLAGNSDLRPERSRQHNLGLVLDVADAVSLSVDAWRIDHLDKIAVGGEYIVGHEADFPGRVVREPASPAEQALGIPGPISAVRDTYINVARRDVRGVDLGLNARLSPRPWGRVSFDATVSWLERFVDRVTRDAQPVELAGGDGRPRLRAQLGADWEGGAWRAAMTLRVIGGYRYDLASGSQARVAAWSTLDLHASWSPEAASRWSFGLRNLGNRAPPRRDDPFGYDRQVHDPIGRAWSIAWRRGF